MAEDDLRAFIRELTVRHERSIERLVRGLERQTDAFVSALNEMRGEIADQRKQIQANTQAVLSVLDRLN
jgi:hypothetical protein